VRNSSALLDNADVRFALSGAGDPGDQPGSRERPILGAVALLRQREADPSQSLAP
jgi:hypothetical protein